MDAARLAEILSAPSAVFTIAAAVFLVLMRSPWPWTRAGATVLAAVILGALGLAFRDPGFRRAGLDPERWPILILALSSAVATWTARHRASRAPAKPGSPEEPWKGLGSAELLLGGLVVLGAAFGAFFLGAPLGTMAADPSSSASEPAAPWFLLPLQDLLGYFDPWVAFGLFPLITIAGLLALPHLDVSVHAEQRRDVVHFFLFVWFLLALLPMTTAAFLDGATGLPLALSKPLSELVWAGGPPRLAWLRELPALTLLALYFFVLPRLLPRWRPTRALLGPYLKRMGERRFYAAMAFMQVWMLVPLKMYCRWLFEIGYFVYLPELGVNL